MGVANCVLSYLLEEAKTRPLRGRLLTLGRQHVVCNGAYLEARAAEKDVPLAAAHGGLDGPALTDVQLFTALGFEEVLASDVSDYEGAAISLDLNGEGVPTQWQAAFDFIYDGGTLEHVFHVPNALKNLHTLLRPGGRILHSLPITNFVDHGFYMFSPTLFLDYYEANRYRQHRFVIHRVEPWDSHRGLGTFYEYDPDLWFRFEGGGLDSAQWTMMLIAEKTADSTSGIVPIQRRYRRIFEQR
jgi:SAM-dependent methyltransferase